MGAGSARRQRAVRNMLAEVTCVDVLCGAAMLDAMKASIQLGENEAKVGRLKLALDSSARRAAVLWLL